MAEKHTLEQIKSYEEDWQRRFYFPSGEGFIHLCEVQDKYCYYTNCVERLPGGHYVCSWCKKKLRLPKEETVIKWGKDILKVIEENPQALCGSHPSAKAEIGRKEIWKKIIKADYMIEMYKRINRVPIPKSINPL